MRINGKELAVEMKEALNVISWWWGLDLSSIAAIPAVNSQDRKDWSSYNSSVHSLRWTRGSAIEPVSGNPENVKSFLGL